MKFVLAHDEARRRAITAVANAPAGHVVVIKQPTRTSEQNAKLHACIQDLANSVEWHGKKLSAVVWKRLVVAAWLRELGESPDLIPALDGNGFDVIYEKTSNLSTKQCASLIEWIICFGAENNVRITN